MLEMCRVWMLIALFVVGSEAKAATIRLIHGNDTFGHLSDDEGNPSLRLAKRVRAIKTLASRQPTVVLSAGNELGPGTLSAWDKGSTMAGLLRQVGTAALAPGPKEFDYGLDPLKVRVQEGNFSLLAANLEGAGSQAYLTM